MGTQDGQRPSSLQIRLDGMNAEEQRLQTFREWPVSSVIDSARIAKAGFFRTGRGLEVECFACGGRISDWSYGDVAMARHRELNPNCPFVRNPTGSSNIPIAIPPSSSPVTQVPKGNLRNETLPIHNQNGPDYRKEEIRLASFCQRDGKRWPKSDVVSPSALAKAGFYWNPSNIHSLDGQVNDRVTCAFCEGSLGGWENGDDPYSEHRRCCNTCPFIMGAPVGNVPISRSPSGLQSSFVEESNAQSQPRCAPEQGIGGNRFGNEKLVEMVSSSNGSSLSGNQGAEMLGVHRHRGPINVRYSTLEARLASFNPIRESSSSFELGTIRNRAAKDGSVGWPVNRIKQTPRSLADAGFFYTGYSDRVRCFHCGGGLWNWQDDDDPWVEHARWFPNCAYVMLVKGEAFIEEAKNLRPPNFQSPNSSSTPISGNISSSSTVFSAEVQPQPSSGPSEFVGRVQSARRPKVRNVTSEELDSLMGSATVLMALEIGLDAGRVRNIVQKKIEETGVPFSSSDDLVLEVLGSQQEERANIVSDHESEDSEEEGGRRLSTILREARVPSRRNFRRRPFNDPEYYSGSESENDEEINLQDDDYEDDDDDTSEDDHGEVEEGELEDGEMIARLLRELSRPTAERISSGNESVNTATTISQPTVQEQTIQESATNSGGDLSENVNSGDLIRGQNEISQINLPGNLSNQISNASEGAKCIVLNSNENNTVNSKAKLENDGKCKDVPNLGNSDMKGENPISPTSTSSLAALEEENRRFRESRLCKVCLDEEVGVVFLPCGHLVSCVHCAPSLKDCPVCRRSIGATVRTYLS